MNSRPPPRFMKKRPSHDERLAVVLAPPSSLQNVVQIIYKNKCNNLTHNDALHVSSSSTQPVPSVSSLQSPSDKKDSRHDWITYFGVAIPV